jgi:hypothetical protein
LDPQAEADTAHYECLVEIENKPTSSPPEHSIPPFVPQVASDSSMDTDSVLSDHDFQFLEWMANMQAQPYPVPSFGYQPDDDVGDEGTDPGVENFGLEYVWRPPYGDPEDWFEGEYIGIQKYLPDFAPVTIADVAIYNTLWPTNMIQYLGENVLPLDACTFDNLCSGHDALEDHFVQAETEYPTEFMGRRPVQYYIDWFQLHNNVEHVEEVAEAVAMDDDEVSCAIDEPEAKRPKVVPGCN